MIRHIRSFVLREGRITTAQAKACVDLWPIYGYDLVTEEIFDPARLFAVRQPLYLEIGFGNGATLAHLATMYPERNFLGIEVHRPGIGHLLLTLKQTGLNNVRLLRRDVVEVIEVLPAACLDGVYIFFPDPWPKARHQKRRLIQPMFIDSLLRVMRSGACLHLATDCENYAQWILTMLNTYAELENADPGRSYVTRPAYRNETRFEKRGQHLGHRVRDIVFYRY